MRYSAIWLRHALGALAIAAASPAIADPPSDPAALAEPETGPIDVVDFATDASDRMTVAVNIAGKGPYPFLIDTGSQRTVISRELAARLRLGSGPTAEIHSISGRTFVQTVIIPSLEINARSVKDIRAPALATSDIGAAGILGIDSLQSQRILLDFKAATMTVRPSTEQTEKWDGETIVVKAKSRFGQLVLADASADGAKVWVIVDTGAQVSIGNEALRRKLFGRKSRRESHPIQILSVTGGTTPADYTTLEAIRLGGMTINNLPVAFADAHPFRKLGLTKRPALLLGMDALRLFDRVSVDFANRKVRFMSGGGASRTLERQTAAAETGPRL
jgi:predicted aspartyl protease